MAAQFIEALVRISTPRDQLAVAIMDIRQGAEAIVLQFDKKIRIIERLTDQG
jgi:hypothetical protein